MSASQIVMSDQESPRHVVAQALCLVMLKPISGANQLCKMLVQTVRILEFVIPSATVGTLGEIFDGEYCTTGEEARSKAKVCCQTCRE